MPRTFRLAVLLGVFVMAGLAFPSIADAQRRGGGGGARGAGGAVHGGAVGGGGHVAVPRTHPPYSYYRPYYSHPYYGHSYYPGFYPRYYSPWSFSLSFGFGGYGGYYAPFYAYPYYPSPYIAPYPAYSYPYPYPPPYPYASPNSSQPQYPSPSSDNGYNNTPSTRTYQADVRPTTRGDDRGEFGTLSMRVMPSDATILIDQQVWDRPRNDDRFSIDLVEGPHQVEIRRAGYATYVRTIDVPRGRSVVVNVALTPGGTGDRAGGADGAASPLTPRISEQAHTRRVTRHGPECSIRVVEQRARRCVHDARRRRTLTEQDETHRFHDATHDALRIVHLLEGNVRHHAQQFMPALRFHTEARERGDLRRSLIGKYCQDSNSMRDAVDLNHRLLDTGEDFR